MYSYAILSAQLQQHQSRYAPNSLNSTVTKLKPHFFPFVNSLPLPFVLNIKFKPCHQLWLQVPLLLALLPSQAGTTPSKQSQPHLQRHSHLLLLRYEWNTCHQILSKCFHFNTPIDRNSLAFCIENHTSRPVSSRGQKWCLRFILSWAKKAVSVPAMQEEDLR